MVGNQLQQRVGKRKEWRTFTDEERQTYSKKVKESEGFDVGYVPSEVLEMGLMRPLWYFEQDPKMFGKLKIFSKVAIDMYNKENKTQYQFVKVLKANRRLVAGFMYYITFQAKDMAGAVPENFQALVYAGICETNLKLCRPEPKS